MRNTIETMSDNNLEEYLAMMGDLKYDMVTTYSHLEHTKESDEIIDKIDLEIFRASEEYQKREAIRNREEF